MLRRKSMTDWMRMWMRMRRCGWFGCLVRWWLLVWGAGLVCWVVSRGREEEWRLRLQTSQTSGRRMEVDGWMG